MDHHLDSFFFKKTVDGIEHDYRITDMEGKFGIEKDGVVIAEIERNENWDQVAGDHLPEKLFDMLVQRIENHYD